MEDCRQVQYHLENLLEEWQQNEPTSHRNKDKRKDTRGAIKCLKDMQECGARRLYSDWDGAGDTATTSSHESRGRREEHSEHHEMYRAERSKSTKSGRPSRPPGSSGRDTFRTTRGRSPEPEHLRFQKTESGQIYGVLIQLATEDLESTVALATAKVNAVFARTTCTRQHLFIKA